MKDSGIDWIGEIPKHWGEAKLKNVLWLKTGTTPKSFEDKDEFDELINWYTPSDVSEEGNVIFTSERKLAKRILDLEHISLYPKGSIMFVGIGALAGKVGYAIDSGYSNQQITALIPKNTNGKFYYYFLLADKKRIRDNAFFTTLPIINNGYLGQVKVLLPSVVEQSRIANFLDKKCAEIDELIALQEQMIAQLNTYKQAVITETVTKGLEPNVKMKDSGVVWIGEIPEHWDIAKMKNFIALVESGVSVNAGGNSAGENEFGVLKTSSVSKYVFDITENKTVFPEEIERLKCPVKANTLIVSRMNTPELVGACGYVENSSYNIYLPDRLWQVHLTSQIHVKFVWYYLRSSFVRAYYSSLSSGTSSSMQNISQEQFANVRIMLPSLSEQQSIANYLDQKCKEIDELISIKKEKIEHLKAYKKSVIYEYVTGKKQVTI